MAYEMKPGQGSMFKNDKKTEDKHPDYKGSVMLPDGTECWVSGWIKRPEGKAPFMSLSVQVKEQQSAPVSNAAAESDATDGLPF
jgi:hypothetical protein